MSPSERAAKIRRCARLIQQGRQLASLRRVYSRAEIEEAAELAKGGKGEK